MYHLSIAIRNVFLKKIPVSLLLLILVSGWTKLYSQEVKGSVQDAVPVISKIALLSIHVSSVEFHDSVYHLLTDKLGLPVDYYPLTYAGRRYAAVYTGNLYLEPCGPFTNFTYASKDFKAIFFGLNCESERTVSSVADELTDKNIEIIKSNAVQVTDSSLTRPNIYINIVSGARKNILKEDSLRLVLQKNTRDALGIEKIIEIRVGYKDDRGLAKWKVLIKPSILSDDRIWTPKEGPSVRFVRSRLREVNAIVFKVKSLEKAQTYLKRINLPFRADINSIALDHSRTFGLTMLLCEK